MEVLLGLSALGLAYDGAGVAILGLASLLEKPSDTHKESQTYWGGNDPLLRRLVTSKYDITAGSIMLLIGFFLQFLASLHIQATPSISVVLCLGLVALPAVYLLVFRRRLIQQYMDEVKRLDAKAK